MDFNSWIRQPTTIHGLAVLAAGAGAALAHVATGNHTVDAAIAVIAYVAVHLGVDDHSAAEQSATALVNDVLAGAAPVKLLADATGAAGALSPTAAPAPAQAAPAA